MLTIVSLVLWILLNNQVKSHQVDLRLTVNNAITQRVGHIKPYKASPLPLLSCALWLYGSLVFGLGLGLGLERDREKWMSE